MICMDFLFLNNISINNFNRVLADEELEQLYDSFYGELQSSLEARNRQHAESTKIPVPPKPDNVGSKNSLNAMDLFLSRPSGPSSREAYRNLCYPSSPSAMTSTATTISAMAAQTMESLKEMQASSMKAKQSTSNEPATTSTTGVSIVPPVSLNPPSYESQESANFPNELPPLTGRIFIYLTCTSYFL